MPVYYIDYENVGSGGVDGIDRLAETDRAVLFHSAKSDTMKIPQVLQIIASKATVEFVYVQNGLPNAMDFQLITDLWLRFDPEEQYCIISRDNGYESSMLRGRNLGYENVRRFPSLYKAHQYLLHHPNGEKDEAPEQPAVTAPPSAAEIPAEESPVEKPAEEIPAEEPAVEEPAQESPAEVPAAEDPAQESPAEEPAVEEPAQESPAVEPAAEEPAQESPAVEPVVEEPAQESPAVEPDVEEPAQESPAEVPAVEEPAQESPAEVPAMEEPALESPAEPEQLSLPAEEPAEDTPAPKKRRRRKPVKEPAPAEGQRYVSREQITKIFQKGGMNLTRDEITLISESMRGTATKQQFYQFFVSRLGAEDGRAVYYKLRDYYAPLAEAAEANTRIADTAAELAEIAAEEPVPALPMPEEAE